MRLRAVMVLALVALVLGWPASSRASDADELSIARAYSAFLGNDFVAARDLLKQALVERQSDAALLHMLGLCEMRLGDDVAALAALRKAKQAGAEGPDFRFDFGVALMRGARLQEAAGEFSAVLAEDPEDPLSHYYLGYLDYRAGRLAAAQKHFELSVRDRELRTPSSYYLSVIDLKAQPPRPQPAQRRLETVAKDPAFPELARSGGALRDALLRSDEVQRGQLYAALGGQYDTNVIQLQIEGGPDETDADGRGLLLVGGGYAPYRGERFELSMLAEGLFTFHASRSDYDMQRYRLRFDLDYTLPALNDGLALGGFADYAVTLMQERRESVGVFQHRANGGVRFSWSQSELLGLRVLYAPAYVDFAEDTDASERSELSHGVMVTEHLIWDQRLRGRLSVEYLVGRDAAEGAFVTRPGASGPGGILGLGWDQPVGGMTLHIDGEVGFKHLIYGSGSAATDKDRVDDLLDARARIGLGLGAGIGVELTWQLRRNFSNSALRRYTRHVAGGFVTWSL